MEPREFNVDPRDEGALPRRLLPLSRTMARVLRHSGPGAGLAIDEEGWCSVAALMRMRELAGWAEADLRTVVKESFSKTRPRFELKQSGEKDMFIRATHKHTCIDGVTIPGLPDPNVEEKRETAASNSRAPASRARDSAAYRSAPPLRVATPQNATGHTARQAPQGSTKEERAEYAKDISNAWAPESSSKPSSISRQRDQEQAAAAPSQEAKETKEAKEEKEAKEATEEKEAKEAKETASGTASESAHAVTSSQWRTWSRYRLPEQDGGGFWWTCSAEEWFTEVAPEPWVKYRDPEMEKVYWYSSATEEWFYV
eukprot:CAMPEP_0179047840 /NCGR_PEP_ID=MMETSP0796-20121207/19404_1 /TAXON_ID=73915 /ORGANISM="Pyrodinium bahamense, Strain pbaha01" /LENGTH=312 /DNA_ID=CAMNT_0020744297 /DNA_START=65 /DNA_END=1003 /DNA_ORIENTATION=+